MILPKINLPSKLDTPFWYYKGCAEDIVRVWHSLGNDVVDVNEDHIAIAKLTPEEIELLGLDD